MSATTARPALTILLVVPGSWHAPELERAWSEQGHRVVVVTSEPEAFPGADLRPIHVGIAGWTSSHGAFQTARLALFSRLAARVVAGEDADVLVVWAGAAHELGPRARLPRATVLVRSGPHALTQARLLADSPRGSWRPSPSAVRRGQQEYARFPVTVPTRAIAADPAWGSVPVVVIGYGFPPVSVDLPERPDGPLRLVTLGEPEWRTGIDRVDRLARLEDVDYITLIAERRRSLDSLDAKLRSVGRQSPSGVADIFRRSHAMVLLSREEGQQRAGMEAMAAGLPIIVTRETGLAAFCEDGAGVVVKADATAGDYSAALARVAAEWSLLSRRAQEIAAERTWADHADEVLAAALEIVHA